MHGGQGRARHVLVSHNRVWRVLPWSSSCAQCRLPVCFLWLVFPPSGTKYIFTTAGLHHPIMTAEYATLVSHLPAITTLLEHMACILRDPFL